MRRKDRVITDFDEIIHIVSRCDVCHLAMIDGEVPYVVPLSFGFETTGHTLTLYFHSQGHGRKISALKQNPHVCFEMLLPMDANMASGAEVRRFYHQSVIGWGRVEFLEENTHKRHAFLQIAKHMTDRSDFGIEDDILKGISVFKVVSSEFAGKEHRRED